MHKLTAILATLAFATTTVAAAPRKPTAKARKAAEEVFVMQCVDERTGPDGGITVDEALQLCRGIVKHQHRIAKLAKIAAQARAAKLPRLIRRTESECSEEVSVACEDTTVRDHDGGECSDATLEAKHAFDVCRGISPVVAKEVK